MKLVIQRVSEASVTVNNEIVGQIGKGLLVLIGIKNTDSEKEADYLVNKLLKMRIFPDDEGRMNKSVQDVDGSLTTGKTLKNLLNSNQILIIFSFF